MKAIWNGQVLAESEKTKVVEGNHYFPLDSVKVDYFEKSDKSTHCPWKGDASYYSIKVEDEKNEDAAWYYPEPYDKATHIKDHVAFWKGVEITE